MDKRELVHYENTYGVLKKLKHDIALAERVVETALQIFFLFYYAYLVYNNLNNTMYLVIYAILGSISLIYFIFYLIGLISKNSFYKKRVRNFVKRIVTIIKYAIRIFTIVFAFVEMYHYPISDFDRIINIVSLVSLCLQMLVSIISHFVSRYIDLFITSIKMDYEESKISDYVEKGERIATDGIKGSILGFINEKAGFSEEHSKQIPKARLSDYELKQRKAVSNISEKYLNEERQAKEERRIKRQEHQRKKLEHESSLLKEGLKKLGIFQKNRN